MASSTSVLSEVEVEEVSLSKGALSWSRVEVSVNKARSGVRVRLYVMQ